MTQAELEESKLHEQLNKVEADIELWNQREIARQQGDNTYSSLEIQRNLNILMSRKIEINDELNKRTLNKINLQNSLAKETKSFVGWILRVLETANKDCKDKTLINARALFYLFHAWCITEKPETMFHLFIRKEHKEYCQEPLEMAMGALSIPLNTSEDRKNDEVNEDVVRIFSNATQIIRTLRRESIEMYHLFAAIIYYRRPNGPGIEDMSLMPSVYSFEQLREKFKQEIISGFYSEAHQEWKTAISLLSGKPVLPTPPPEKPTTKPPSNEDTPIGGKNNFSRNTPEQDLCLNFDKLSQSLAETINSASKEDDFVFALYGKWGQGKTTLINLVAKKLEIDKQYKTVRFSAWKYTSAPELWIHLYQRIAEEAQKAPWPERIKLNIRIGLINHGFSAIFLTLGSILILLLSRGSITSIFTENIATSVTTIGLIAAGYFSYLKDILTSQKEKIDNFLKTPDHSEKLGLQSLIGRDLKNLLIAWISKPISTNEKFTPSRHCDFEHKPTKWKSRFILILTSAIILTATFLTYCYLFQARSPINTSRITDFILHYSKFLNPSQATIGCIHDFVTLFAVTLPICIGTICLFLAFISFSFLTENPTKTRRLLLIIDDLDRCPSDQMIKIMEGLRLFLDEQDISKRVSIAMLLDKRIYNHALNENAPKDLDKIEDLNYFKEAEEKMFILTYEIRSVSRDDIQSLATSIIGKPTENTNLKKSLDHLPEELAVDINSESTTPAKSETEPTQNTIKAVTALENIELTDGEKRLLIVATSKLPEKRRSPRSIRSFKNRYIFVRLAQNHLGYTTTPNQLIDSMIELENNEKGSYYNKLPQQIQNLLMSVYSPDPQVAK